jgi:hypothetical protein
MNGSAAPVETACKTRADLLSGSGLPHEQNWQRSRGQAPKQRFDSAHRRRDAESALRAITHAQRHHVTHLLKQAGELERLRQIVVCAGAYECYRLIDLAVRCHENERRRERTGVRHAKDFVTTHVRQPNVAEHEVRANAGHLIHGSLSGVPPYGAPTL